MSFPLPNDILQSPHVAFKQIMQEVQNLQNGAISRQMQERGLHYKLNYGVVAPLLKEIASGYKKDNALATQLWNSGIREGLLLSSFLFEPTKMSIERLLEISRDICNIELIEQFSLNLMGYLSNLKEVIEALLQGSSSQKQLAFYSMSWGLKRNALDSSYASLAIVVIDNLIDSDPEPILKGINVAMQSILSNDSTLSDKVFALAEKLEQSNNEHVRVVGKEFLWLHSD